MEAQRKQYFALVVDDSEINLMICEDLLMEFGVSSLLAGSGAEALKAVENNDFDIIFLDHVMPEMDGVELCRRIRAMGGRPAKVPIIILTGNDVERYKRTYIDAGIDLWLTKPVGYESISRVLGEKLGVGVPDERKEKTSDRDKKILKAFLLQVREKVPLMEKHLIDGKIGSYSIEAHSFKSSLLNVGEPELSEMARELERLAETCDIDTLNERNPALMNGLRECSKRISEKLEDENAGRERPNGDLNELYESLEKVKALMDDFEASDAADIVRELTERTYGRHDRQIEELDALFNAYAYDRVGGALSGLMISVKFTKGE